MPMRGSVAGLFFRPFASACDQRWGYCGALWQSLLAALMVRLLPTSLHDGVADKRMDRRGG